MFPFLFTFILFLVILNYFVRKNTRLENDKHMSFWLRENQANTARKKDISNLPYIQLSLENFPLGQYQDDELAVIEQQLLDLRDTQILNLNACSNTELKERYGIANLSFLSECDERFTTLAPLLIRYAKKLSELGDDAAAITVLEFGVTNRSDIVENYTLLASLYEKTGQTTKLRSLLAAAKTLTSPRQDTIVQKLSALCHTA